MLPIPVPGLVIRYSYLWRREHLMGREEGQKDRPCAIVAAIRTGEKGETRALVLPITHIRPDPPVEGIEIPTSVKQRLHLDDEQSWIVLSEWNEFVWPGPDVRFTPYGETRSVAYGMLPPGLFSKVRDGFLNLLSSSGADRVTRT